MEITGYPNIRVNEAAFHWLAVLFMVIAVWELCAGTAIMLANDTSFLTNIPTSFPYEHIPARVMKCISSTVMLRVHGRLGTGQAQGRGVFRTPSPTTLTAAAVAVSLFGMALGFIVDSPARVV